MLDRDTFRRKLETALDNIRDVVRLQSMDLADLLLPLTPRSQRGWELSTFLLRRIDDLRPVEDDAESWAYRRFQLLTLRYVNDLSADDVAARMQVSRRHYYRQLQRALDELSDALWAEVALPAPIQPDSLAVAEQTTENLDLLQRESAALLQQGGEASLAQVIQNVIGVLGPLFDNRDMPLQCDIPKDLPLVALNSEILKQFLLGLLGDLTQREETDRIIVRACGKNGGIAMTIEARSRKDAKDAPALPCESPLLLGRGSTELALLQGVRIESFQTAGGGLSYWVYLPGREARAVLVVDDNDDVGLLFRRYLVSGGYHPVVVNNAAAAIAMARSRRFHAVTLDLMMDQKDGWDVLQTLTNDLRTEYLPIVVCSVLDQKDLALALGATAFLKKPVLREALLETLAGLKPRRATPVEGSPAGC